MTKEIKIAITAILAVAIIYVGIIFLKGLKLFGSDHIYYVEMKDVSGLSISSEVLASGMNIGTVKGIEYDAAKQNITVAIDVRPDFRIPEGSCANISKEMLGGAKLNIQLGKNTAKNIAIGDTIAGKQTIDIMTAAADMVPQVQALLPKLDSILTSVSQLTSDPALTASMKNMEYITSNLKTTTDRLNGLLASDVPQLVRKTNAICANLETTTNNLKEVDFNGMAQNANKTMEGLQIFTNRLNNENSTLGMFLNDASVYNHLDSTMINASLLLQDLREHPKRYVHFSLFGKKDK
ncbi:MAG: MlaD family protein [Bacteroides sp.]|nr:MlaD family protein [Roseburia sp.]MCM1345840.1 MlaD family protein [Bacteroides sp.]MCM1420230.1 MlaD family protein [Bacteroides sp.]